MPEDSYSPFEEWIRCPDCGSENASITFWWSDRDMSIKCGDCGNAEYFS